MNTEAVWGFWDYFSTGADIVSYLSIIISAITLFTTFGIRKSLLTHIEKNDYLKDIDEKIKKLRSYEETLDKDGNLCNAKLLDLIYSELDDVVISYETILKKKIINEIKDLQHLIENSKDPVSSSMKRNCKKQLHSVCARLEKEKKIL